MYQINHLHLGPKNLAEVKDSSHEMYSVDSQIKFKISILRLSLCDYSDAYILVTRTISITGEGADNATKRTNERNKGVLFKNCAPFIKCISETNNM